MGNVWLNKCEAVNGADCRLKIEVKKSPKEIADFMAQLQEQFKNRDPNKFHEPLETCEKLGEISDEAYFRSRLFQSFYIPKEQLQRADDASFIYSMPCVSSYVTFIMNTDTGWKYDCEEAIDPLKEEIRNQCFEIINGCAAFDMKNFHDSDAAKHLRAYLDAMKNASRIGQACGFGLINDGRTMTINVQHPGGDKTTDFINITFNKFEVLKV